MKLDKNHSPITQAQKNAPGAQLAPESLALKLDNEFDFAERGITLSPRSDRSGSADYLTSLRKEKLDAETKAAEDRARADDLHRKLHTLPNTPSDEDVGTAQDAASAALSRNLLQTLQPRLR